VFADKCYFQHQIIPLKNVNSLIDSPHRYPDPASIIQHAAYTANLSEGPGERERGWDVVFVVSGVV
jgi:hypothetical protein